MGVDTARLSESDRLFAVVFELEDGIEAVFVSEDREQAHRVLDRAQEVDREVAGTDPQNLASGRFTLLSEVTNEPESFYTAIRSMS